MSRPISPQSGPVTLIGGGEATPQMLSKALQFAPTCIAADGGARVALDAGVIPDAVIGDFDSLDAETRASLPPDRVHHVPDQDSTDFEKCLASTNARLILGVGFLGKRMDHTLAAYSALLNDARPIILLSETELCFIAPSRVSLDLADGVPVALYPLLPCTVTSEGLRYPLDRADVAPDGLISTSNHATGTVSIATDRHGLLVILPENCLETVIQSLTTDAAHAK
ncbi:thiamine diphosphokinase [Shimia ponticola]|uniref:thiamine diphosphokinase n=1 Tax=Shimia ponticola TaxID=2582893 RepID=UPI0011BEFEB3|nr:thiamine diphosphokinase [Shimia ponticola]